MTIILAVPLILSPVRTTDIFHITYNDFRSGNIVYSHCCFKITVIKSTTRSCYSVKKSKHYFITKWVYYCFINIFQSNWFPLPIHAFYFMHLETLL